MKDKMNGNRKEYLKINGWRSEKVREGREHTFNFAISSNTEELAHFRNNKFNALLEHLQLRFGEIRI